MIKPKALFICGANARRTQIAEGFLRDLAGDRFNVFSAGYEPSDELCSDAIAAMREVGIDISSQQPKHTEEFIGQRFGVVITLCDREKERSCPIFPGTLWHLVWPLDDPSAAESEAERVAAIRRTRDAIHQRIVEFVSQHA